MEWSNRDMLQFAKVATEGAYGDYRGCKSLESKLIKYRRPA